MMPKLSEALGFGDALLARDAPRKIEIALVHLKIARDLLVAAKAPNAAQRVRLAIKSAEGAHRHAVLFRDRPDRIRRGRPGGPSVRNRKTGRGKRLTPANA